tara:strand:- start:582 stop:983 length:402 start_codon:yes stop_codon:yes gene_type:complete
MNLNLRFLCCTLFTINPQGPFYKKFRPFTLINDDFILKSNQESLNFYLELNEYSTRQTAKKILAPVLLLSKEENKKLTKHKLSQTLTLRNYIKKFRRNYFTYFDKYNAYGKKSVPTKTLNTIALNYLFLIAGL